MQKLAKEKGGFCVSETYIDAKTKLTWRCRVGHEWEAKLSNIKSGRWCPKCAGRSKYSLDDIQNFASRHSGECLSKEYINNKTKLDWKCICGHKMRISFDKIRRRKFFCTACETCRIET